MTTLKRVALLKAGGTPSVDDPAMWSESEEEGIAWVSIGDMSDGQPVVTTARRVSESGVASKRLPIGEPGTLLFAMYASVGAVGRLATQATWNQALLGIEPHDGLSDERFLGYWLEHLRPSLAGLTRSNTQDNLNAEQVGNFPFPDIPLAEQRTTADYLDAETARIDALIAKKRQLIHLLAVRRGSVTLAGVTGGLTHPADLVPCDLAWAEGVPRHWDVALLRLVAEQGTGHTPSRDHPEWWVPNECVVPWVTTGEVRQVRSDRVRIVYETRERISQIGIENSSAEVHPKDTVFLCRTAASAGYSGIMGCDMATSQDIATWTCGDRLDPEFLLFCLRAMREDLLKRLATGSTHKTIYMPEIQGLRVPVPPIDEQCAIVKRLKVEIDTSFAATDALARQLNLLAEHRQALITAAVTGEFDVPGAA